MVGMVFQDSFKIEREGRIGLGLGGRGRAGRGLFFGVGVKCIDEFWSVGGESDVCGELGYKYNLVCMLQIEEDSRLIEDAQEGSAEEGCVGAIRALLSGNRRDFEEITSRLYPGRLQHFSVSKIHNSLELSEGDRKKLEAALSEKVVEALDSSQQGDCFFEHSTQINLHYFIRNVYQDSKYRIKLPAAIPAAYLRLASKITQLQDFIEFAKMLRIFHFGKVYEELEFDLINIVTPQRSGNHGWKMAAVFDSMDQETKLILHFHIITLLLVHSSTKRNMFDCTFSMFLTELEKFPYQQLLNHMISNDLTSFTDKIQLAVLKQKITYDFANRQAKLHVSNFLPELLGWETISAVYQALPARDWVGCMSHHPAVVEDKNIHLKFNLHLLSYFAAEYRYNMANFDTEPTSKYINFFKLLLDHKDHTFITLGDANTTNFNVQYICKAFEFLEKLFENSNFRFGRGMAHIPEGVIVHLAECLNKWSKNEEIKNEPYLRKAIESLFAIFLHTNNPMQEEVVEFPSLMALDSELSKNILEILTRLPDYHFSSNAWKGIKIILLRWGQIVLAESEQYKIILRKFLEALFQPNFAITVRSSEDLLDTPSIAKIFKKMLSIELVRVLDEKVQEINQENIDNQQHPAVRKHAHVINKIAMILGTKIPFDMLDNIGSLLYILYSKYAHHWPLLYSFRMWILQNFHKQYENNILDRLVNLDLLFRQIKKEEDARLANKQRYTASMVQKWLEFEDKSHQLINCFHLKRHKQVYTKEIYEKYFILTAQLQDSYNRWEQPWHDGGHLLEDWIQWGINVQKQLHRITEDLKINIRYFLCNSSKLLHIQQEENIMRNIAEILNNLQPGQTNRTVQIFRYINELIGLNNTIAIKPTLLNPQILGPLHKYTSRLNPTLQLEEFTPFNFLSTLYVALRKNYTNLLNIIFATLEQTQQDEDIWLILERILFPAVNTNGPCIFNGANHQKAKEDMVYGLYFEQFGKLTSILIEEKEGIKVGNKEPPKEVVRVNVQIILKLESRKILSKWFEMFKTKGAKIVDKARGNSQEYRRFNPSRAPPPAAAVIERLVQSGVPLEQAEIVLQNIDIPDQNLAIEWIDNNQERLDQMVMQRALERSKNEGLHRGHIIDNEKSEDKIVQMGIEVFSKDQSSYVKVWIKGIYKELFKPERLELAEALKDILFLNMDNLPEKSKTSQYNYLNTKVYADIDELNKDAVISPKIKLLLSILQGTFEKAVQAKKDFYDKSINLKILSFLPRLANRDDQLRVFQLINATLPVFLPDEALSAPFQQYLKFLLDITYRHRHSHKCYSDILFKIARSKNEQLMARVTRNFTVFLKENLITENIFSLAAAILESNQQLSLANAELDLKTYLYERYKGRIATFHPDKEHVLEIDIKEFSTSFSKYERGSAIYTVSKVLLSKKKGKNRFFYYDCRKPANSFDYSAFAETRFLDVPIRPTERLIIRSLLSILFSSTVDKLEDAVAQVHRILLNYRILLPCAVREVVDGKTLIDWLLNGENHSKRKLKLMVFLTLNCNLFAENDPAQPYSFFSLADYVCGRIAATLSSLKADEMENWTIFGSLYLLQVKKFSDFAFTMFSPVEPITLEDVYEKILEKASPEVYVAISDFLYIQYKRRLLDNLRRKYKFVGSQNEETFDRQFLSLSPFFNTLPVVAPRMERMVRLERMEQERLERVERAERRVRPIEVQLENMEMEMEEDEQEDEMNEEEEEEEMMLGSNIHLRYGHHRIIPRSNGPLLETFIIPIQNKDNKEKSESQQNVQPILIRNNFYIKDVLAKFEEYFKIIDEKEQPALENLELDIPQAPLALPNEQAKFDFKIEDTQLDIEIKVKKLAGFERRVVEVLKIIDSTIIWEKKEIKLNRPPLDMGNRLFETLNHLNSENREEMVAHLERMMANRYGNHEEEQVAPQRPLNTGEIFESVEFFIEPIIPVVPVQEVPIEEPPKVEEQKLEVEIVEIELKEPEVDVVVNPQVVEEPQVQEILEDIVPGVNEPNANEPNANEPNANEPNAQIDALPELIPIPDSLINNIPEIPADIAQLIDAVHLNPPPGPPQIDREILRVFGLPQTFLQDVGLDAELFDQLPQELQQEQLMHLMSQQQAHPNRNQGQNNSAQDQQNENLAFIASLDPQTRAQILMEATPDFLLTLPPSFREEAERYRHQHINNIIEEEEIEEERNIAGRPKVELVYPKVYREEFTMIKEQTAVDLFKGLFSPFPNFRLSVLKVLLENKQNQQNTLASIIILLRMFESRMESVSKSANEIFKDLLMNMDAMRATRIDLLHLIYEHLKTPLYKDEDFLPATLSPNNYVPLFYQLIGSPSHLEPQTELLSFALAYYPELATELIKRIQDLPVGILKKIVKMIKGDKLPKGFYENLQNFSENETLKELFSEEFEQNPPKTEIMGSLVRYKFAHLKCLRQMHAQTLQFAGSSSLQFLNQIFSIYTLQSLGEVEAVLLRHKNVHFQVIKYLIEKGRELEKEPIGIILKKPHLLDFETKKFIFRNHARIRKQARHRLPIEVDRAHLFQGSYNQLMSRSVRELQGRIQVSFVNEQGYDAGGLKREWFLVVSREIFNQNYCLFEKSSSGSTYQPNPRSYVNPDHLNYFKFIGRFVGKALVERELIEAFFTRAFYKMILGQDLEFRDLEQQDYDFYKSMEWLKDNPVDENTFTFSYIYDNFGNRLEKELVPGGRQLVVNEDNKKDYIEKYSLAKMRDDFSAQIKKFLEGFHEIVPQECISFFEAKELELLISGVPEVDLEDMRKNTDYSGYNPTDQIIVWFWEVVSEYSQEELAKLVQFITGTSKIPVEGFSQIVGMNGIQRISIHRDPCDHQLPKSHTCFNQLDLPNYPSKEVLRQKLSICLAWGSEGFGFM